MRVFVAGATGVAGRRAVRHLVEAGHEVVGVARSPEKVELLVSMGASPAEVDLFDAAAVRSSLKGHDAVVNLATKIPPVEKALLPGAWKENDRIRTQVSSNLVEGALASDVGCYVQESIAFVYPDSGDRWIDEDVEIDPPPHALSVLDAEGSARRFSESGGTGVVLRFGQFYAPDAAHMRSMIKTARRKVSPFVGPPDAYAPVIHAEDVGRAVVHALDAPPGVYNIVDDEPLRQQELAKTLAGSLGVEKLRFAPAPMVRLGGPMVRMLMRSQRVSNRRFREATHWRPTFPDARAGIPPTVAEATALDA